MGGMSADWPRIGVIGCGSIGRTHLAAYRANGVAPVAVADADSVALDRAVREFGGRGFIEADELIGRGIVDAISVCTPPASHRGIVERALRAEIAVLCEKPMATTVEDAEAMVASAEQTGVLLAVGFCHRFQPQIERMRDLTRSGELGTVLMFRNRFAGHLREVEKRWFSNGAIAGGGVLFDTSVHSIDLFRYLVGEPVRVEALMSSTATLLGPALDVEDTGVIVLRSESGTLGVIEASWRTPPGEWILTLYGTRATAEMDYGTNQLRLSRPDQTEWDLIETPDGNRFEREIAHFLACVRGKDSPRVTAADGLSANRVLVAAYASAVRGDGGTEGPRDGGDYRGSVAGPL